MKSKLLSILLITIMVFTPLQAFAQTNNNIKTNFNDIKVGDVTEFGVVTAVDENGFFFKIDETRLDTMQRASGSLHSTFDNETTLDTTFYIDGYVVCENINFSGAAGPIQFKLDDVAVGVPVGSGYSFTELWGRKTLTAQAIEVWGYRYVTWKTV